ncbi:MFS transporter [Brevibacillus choshinensis]|uniref:MFS transporter n=1 Tax=Brevibacillus choshinensis TaxID=54911 RepID=UPI0006EC0AE2|nr:MFS transporter [Brevibacillus choshinensis]
MRVTNQRFGREFWALWMATALSNLGDGLFKFVLPLLAVRLTDSPVLVAGVSSALTLPWLLFALPVGVVVDRLDRKRIMVVVNLIRTAAVGSLAFAQQFDWLTVFVLGFLAFLVGTCETVSDTTSGALVPSVVNHDRLEQANARIISAETIMNSFIGGPLGGYLLTIGLLLPAVGSAASFLAAAVALLLMRGHFTVERKQPAGCFGRRSLFMG